VLCKLCPRCKKFDYNTFTLTKNKLKVAVNKCKICGYLWIEDKDMLDMAKADLLRLFIADVKNAGKEELGEYQSTG
jgi:transcription elongation factor Elf1